MLTSYPLRANAFGFFDVPCGDVLFMSVPTPE